MDKYFEAQELKAKASRMEQEAFDELFGNDEFGAYIPTENDIMVIQYLRPNGKKRIVYAPLGIEYVKKSKNMVCSAEELMNGQVVIYVRWDYQTDEEELIEFATNGPGDNSPNEVLMKMIDRLWNNKVI